MNRKLGLILVLSILALVGSACGGGGATATPVPLAATPSPAFPTKTPTLPPQEPTPSPKEPTPLPEEPTPTPSVPTPPESPTLSPETDAQLPPTPDIVVDNADAGFTIEAGDWGTCQNGDCCGTCYGDDFRYADPGCTACRARFDLVVPSAGEYDVWTWWPWGEDRATDTSFTILYGDGPLTVDVDQRNSGDAWFWLATLAFKAGESVSVIVEASDTGYANADAVALTPLGSGTAAQPTEQAPTPTEPPDPTEPPEPTEPPTVPVAPTEQPATPPASPPPAEAGRRIIFLHHSCGANLIEQGNVRQRLTDLGYEFYDHGYNGDGLVLADGTWTGRNFDVPGDNTDPDGFAAIFAQPLHDPPDNTFSHLMQYDVIAFKSCFPASNIWSDERLAEYRSYYLSIRDRMDGYPDKIFVVVTQPPQVPANSEPAEAARARAFVNWLQSDEYLAGHPNVFVFDFFGLLAGDDSFLRPEYRMDEYDAHPNELANRTIGPLFVEFVDRAIRTYAGR